VKRVNFAGDKRPRFKTVTFAPWTVDRIRDRGFVLVYIDAFGTDRFDFYAMAQSNGNQMVGRLYRDRRKKKDVPIAYLDVWRHSKQSVSVRIPLSKVRMPESRTYYRWYVLTLFTGPSCQKVCFDKAPNGKPITQPVPGITPTPTPSSTPSPAPTTSPSPTPTSSPTATPEPIPTVQ
jgi:hypothetical protein